MSLAILIGATIVLFVLGLLGYWRDIQHSVMALTGTLLGVVLTEFWGQIWGHALARQLGTSDEAGVTGIVSSVAFLLTAVIVGYGGSLLMHNISEPSTFTRRLVGVLLGLLNGAVMIGYVLRFATKQNPTFAATVRTTAFAREIHDGLPILLLAVTCVVTVLVVIRVGFQAISTRRLLPDRRRLSQKERQRQVIEKIERRTGQL